MTLEELYKEAVEAVRAKGMASAPFLQRKLRIAYATALLLMVLMEKRGVIGKDNGSKPREIL